MNNLTTKQFNEACFYDKLDYIKSLLYNLTFSTSIIHQNADKIENKNNFNEIYKELKKNEEINKEISEKLSLLFIDERKHIDNVGESRFKAYKKFNFVPAYLLQKQHSEG